MLLNITASYQVINLNMRSAASFSSSSLGQSFLRHGRVYSWHNTVYTIICTPFQFPGQYPYNSNHFNIFGHIVYRCNRNLPYTDCPSILPSRRSPQGQHHLQFFKSTKQGWYQFGLYPHQRKQPELPQGRRPPRARDSAHIDSDCFLNMPRNFSYRIQEYQKMCCQLLFVDHIQQ